MLEQLENDGPLAVKLAVEGVEDLEPSETTELSLLICDDNYIHNLNKEWRGEDSPTDVLSFPQDQSPGVSSLVRFCLHIFISFISLTENLWAVSLLYSCF